MFDGVPEQFHQFIAPRTTSSLPLHLSFPNSNAFPPTTPFDPYNNHLPLLHHQPNLLHSPPPTHKDSMTNLQQINQREGSQLPDLIDSCTWTHDEVVALFRIRSTMDTTWFPDLTWEHVSRKLAEVGFKRSPEKCKEKFEEESRYLSNINYNVDNYRFLSELEQEFYQGHHHHNQKNPEPEPEPEPEKPREGEGQQADKTTSSGQALEEPYPIHDSSKSKERKRKKDEDDQFEMFKGFCENIVNKMMAQQEEMHNKLLEDMMKRDEEKFTREEAWKKQEIERMNKELEMMAQEQAVAGDRQATVIEFLKKFTATSNTPATCSPPTILHSQNPNQIKNIGTDECSPPSTVVAAENPTLMEVGQNPSSSTCTWSSSSGKGDHKDSVGRRWPRDEVLALINLRCSVNNSNVNGSDEGNNKTPLWERISQGMSELGYKRSAKRCKEKWENINKYFRKTKDINKKRSLDSRTCPYFHQLTTLYTQGTLIASQSQSPQNMNHGDHKTTTMQQPQALDTDHHI